MDTRVPGYRDFKTTVQAYNNPGIKRCMDIGYNDRGIQGYSDTMIVGYRDTRIQGYKSKGIQGDRGEGKI